jgi:hypothetical protein
MTHLIRRTADTALGYTIAIGAWAFAIATYPAAVAVALMLAPSARAFDLAMAQHLAHHEADTTTDTPWGTSSDEVSAGPHDARAWMGVGRGA